MSESKKRKKFKETLAELDDDVFPISDFCEHEILFKVWAAAYDELDSLRKEVESVLGELDHLAEVWGDEGVFRRCRDRLRKALSEVDK